MRLAVRRGLAMRMPGWTSKITASQPSSIGSGFAHAVTASG